MRKIITTILIVILCLLPLSAFAADKLDNETVIETRKTIHSGVWYLNLNDFYINTEVPEVYDEGETVYVMEVIPDFIYGNSDGTIVLNYLKCNTKYGIRFMPLYDTNTYDYPKPEPKPEPKKEKKKSSSSGGDGHSKKVKITAYCSQCNGGGGTGTASGVKAYVGGCAMKGVPFGTVVHTSYGDFTVIDRPGGSNILDIYVGECDHCRCSSAGYHGREVVWW